MAEKSTEKSLFQEKNEGFTDTGSAKITETIENTDEIRNDTQIFNQNQLNPPEGVSNPYENQEKPEESKQSAAKNIEIPQAYSEFARETKNLSAKNGLFSPESVSSFKNEFPFVDVEALRNSDNFNAFLSILTETPTLSKVYKYFNDLAASIEEKANQKLLQRLANGASAVGPLSSTAPVSDEFYTREQVKSMSAEEIKKNYHKIRQSQAKW